MAKQPDLRDPAFQSRVSDEQIQQVIKLGRGAMPPHDLPASTVEGLVRLIRLLDASRVPHAAGADAGTDASSGGNAADAGVAASAQAHASPPPHPVPSVSAAAVAPPTASAPAIPRDAAP
jgi:hypothetical protein